MVTSSEKNLQDSMVVCWAASQGDLHELQRLYASGVDLNAADYDGRTGLHLAASEGHLDAAKFLLAKGVDLAPKDRFGGTPLIDAKRGNFKKIIGLLGKNGAR
jgi:glutaminase